MSQQNAYENRVLNKTNFLLKKYGEHTKKYPNYSKYTNWLKKKNVPSYNFSYETEDGLKIRISKRQKNKPKVLAIKDYMVKMESKEVGVDEIATFIAIYTIIDSEIKKTIDNGKIEKEKQAIQTKTTPKSTKVLESKEPKSESVSESKPEPELLNLEPPDDWESLI